MAWVASAGSSGQCRWRCRPGAGSCRGRPSTFVRPFHDDPGSELSLNNVLQGVVHQRQVSVHALELGVPRLQLAQPGPVRHAHPGELALPLVVRRLADAVLPARLAHPRAQLDFLQDANDLAFTELRFLHVETPFHGILYFRMDQVFEVASCSMFAIVSIHNA